MPDFIPREFIGVARVFRSKVLTADCAAMPVISGIAREIARRLRTHDRLRPEHAIDLARRWRLEVPSAGRIGLQVETGKRGTLRIRELRLSAVSIAIEGWSNDVTELGVSLMAIGLDVERGCPSLAAAPLAAIGLHALGRRFQRGRDSRDEILLAEFKLIAARTDELVDVLDLAVEVPGGVWRGAPMHLPADGETILALRTFLPH